MTATRELFIQQLDEGRTFSTKAGIPNLHVQGCELAGCNLDVRLENDNATFQLRNFKVLNFRMINAHFTQQEVSYTSSESCLCDKSARRAPFGTKATNPKLHMYQLLFCIVDVVGGKLDIELQQDNTIPRQ